MKRWELINYLIEKYNYQNYLEIGTRDARNFKKVKSKNKIGVDPEPTYKHPHIYEITSDLFFKNNKQQFDIIFIDGLHYYEQVKRDILNSLDILKKDGIIICHDINPPEKINQIVPQQTKYWNGTCWKAFADLRRNRSDLKMYTVDTDWGIGLIQHGEQIPINYPNDIEWDFDEHLNKDRKNIINLISIEEFKQIF